MPTDREILYSMLDREVENLLRVNPVLSVFSGTIKSYLHNFLDPYLNFFMDGDDLQVDMATTFMKQEMISKMESFKQDFLKNKEGL